jgi:leucyl aminopeptidase
VKVEILQEADLHQAGMEALLAVGKGSQNKSAVVIMTWNGNKRKTPPVVVVGKGICFDSGGLCLKKPHHQLDMKWDKAGAGVVAGLIKALALQKAAVNIVGVIGLAENMPDGNATRPGDIIRTKSGQTVEIADTDAEGRLVLADCLWYAKERFKPSVMIDLGTLTIETIACLGNRYGGLYSSCPKLAANLKEAGRVSGDEVWELPMGEFFAKQIESSVADMKNVGSELCGENGAAAEFLRRFVGDVPWAHLDIAGVSWTKEDLPLASKGVIGFGVRLLEEWVMANQ